MTAIVVGVDGGGSKTHVIVANEQGEQIAEAIGAPSAMRSGCPDDSADVIAETVREALGLAGVTDEAPRAACIGVAGVGREADRRLLSQALVAREIAEDVVVRPDFNVALDDAFGDGAGILLICGTGSVAVGRSPAGVEARCGGWGPVCGDEGSGGWIGRRALSIVTAAADGREPTTALTGAVLTAAELNDIDDLVAWAGTATPAMFAALAPVVLREATAGDLRADTLVSLAVEELVLHVRTLARQLFVDERAAVPVALSGGMFKRGLSLRKRFERRLKTAVPGATVSSEAVNAARGAVRGAVKLLKA